MEESESEGAETEPLVKPSSEEQPPVKLGRNRSPAASCKLPLVPENKEIYSHVFLQDSSSSSTLCPSFFGVKHYLHHFYEKPDHIKGISAEFVQPEEVYLLKQGESACSSSVFRLSLVLGGLILLLGGIAFGIAVCASKRMPVIGQVGDAAVVDRVAKAHNSQVDALLLVGLVAVTLGSTVIVSALISRTFCSKQEELEAFRFTLVPAEGPAYPGGKKVPVTELLTQIQPTWVIRGTHSGSGSKWLP